MPGDPTTLDDLLRRFVDDLGATVNAASVVIGDKLGLYKALAEIGPATPTELATHTRTLERYVAEWLAGQAAGGYVTYDPATRRYRLTAEQALTLADDSSGVFMPGAFHLALAGVRDEPRIAEAFHTGEGVGRHERTPEGADGCQRLSRPVAATQLTSAWVPALDGVEAKLVAGARVADVGCGDGTTTIQLARTYPDSIVTGFDRDRAMIDRARRAAGAAGLGHRVGFEVASATTYPKAGYDLVTMLHRLHELGDPVGAASHVRASLAPDGTWLLVEPAAADRVEGNLNPVGRMYYGLSTLLCVPGSLSREAGLALGAQAGEGKLREVATAAGFTRFRRVAETPLNLVLEARP